MSAWSARVAEFTPSAPTTRSWVAASSSTGGASVVNRSVDAELAAPRLEDLQQPLAAHRREAVPAAGDHLAAEVHVDVVPAGELARHRAVDRRVGVLDAAERLVGEHHAEAEGVVGGVALPHGDLVAGVELLGERREVQSARPAPDNRNSHVSLSRNCKVSTVVNVASSACLHRFISPI